MQNYSSNLLMDEGKDQIVVVEADEYDRSFLTLSPDIAIITAMDADHLDVYGDLEQMTNSFGAFIKRIKPGGKLIINQTIYQQLREYIPAQVQVYQYGIDSGILALLM